MRKLVITVLILFCFNNLRSQEQFNGIWHSEDSSYLTFLLCNSSECLEALNISLDEHRSIKENIIKKKKDTLFTSLYNKKNKYSVSIKYYLKSKDTLISEYSGDLKKKIILTKII